jgi:hypothetical protein
MVQTRGLIVLIWKNANAIGKNDQLHNYQTQLFDIHGQTQTSEHARFVFKINIKFRDNARLESVHM